MSDFLTYDKFDKLRQNAQARRARRAYNRSNIGSITDLPASGWSTPKTGHQSCVQSLKGMEMTKSSTLAELPQVDVVVLVPVVVLPSKDGRLTPPASNYLENSKENSMVGKQNEEPTEQNLNFVLKKMNTSPDNISSSTLRRPAGRERNDSFEVVKTLKTSQSSPWNSPKRSMSSHLVTTPNNISKMKMAVKRVMDQNKQKTSVKPRASSLSSQDALAYENFVRARIREQFPDGVLDDQVDKSQSDLTVVNMYTQAIKPVLVDRLPLDSLLERHFDLRKKRSYQETKGKQPEILLADMKKQSSLQVETTLEKFYTALRGVNAYPKLLGASVLTFLIECAIRDGHLLLRPL